ncbi:hypothetical protein FS935_06960 [Metabacillus litoralis]|uniref:Uncharacterized protein n=1 Tax=Metabacillus litoralis TaxID=152268 RepID=A0A5C6W2J1_9BACI|nr:hypothetical protein [Metabacillus litoralis]TXC92114.1 hypothetical protein FS935_06960 [Metabacillus litoralis]
MGKYNWTVVTCVQTLLWACYNIIEWLSTKDGYIAKGILFIFFFYLSYLVAFNMLKLKKRAILLSSISLIIYGIGYEIFGILRSVY